MHPKWCHSMVHWLTEHSSVHSYIIQQALSAADLKLFPAVGLFWWAQLATALLWTVWHMSYVQQKSNLLNQLMMYQFPYPHTPKGLARNLQEDHSSPLQPVHMSLYFGYCDFLWHRGMVDCWHGPRSCLLFEAVGVGLTSLQIGFFKAKQDQWTIYTLYAASWKTTRVQWLPGLLMCSFVFLWDPRVGIFSWLL